MSRMIRLWLYFCGTITTGDILSLSGTSLFNYYHWCTLQKPYFCWYYRYNTNNCTASLVAAEEWGTRATTSLVTSHSHSFLQYILMTLWHSYIIFEKLCDVDNGCTFISDFGLYFLVWVVWVFSGSHRCYHPVPFSGYFCYRFLTIIIDSGVFPFWDKPYYPPCQFYRVLCWGPSYLVDLLVWGTAGGVLGGGLEFGGLVCPIYE